MKVISSQDYINYDIVEEKIAQLDGQAFVTLPIVDTEMDWDGERLFVLIDGHHRLEAAKEMGIEVRFEEVKDPEGLTGDNLLEQRWIDTDWYYVETEASENPRYIRVF